MTHQEFDSMLLAIDLALGAGKAHRRVFIPQNFASRVEDEIVTKYVQVKDAQRVYQRKTGKKCAVM
jgi:hypothetical protein